MCRFHIRHSSHIHFNKKVSKLILRRELAYSPNLVCLPLAGDDAGLRKIDGTYVAFGACATAKNVGYANEQPRMPSKGQSLSTRSRPAYLQQSI
jgi:hypothetical protein